MTIDELKPKQSAYIRSMGENGALRYHLLDMGLIPCNLWSMVFIKYLRLHTFPTSLMLTPFVGSSIYFCDRHK